MKNPNLYLKNIFCIFSLLISASSFSQLDSSTVDLQLETWVDVTENNDTITGKYFNATVWVNDMDFFGEVVITAYDHELNYPVNMVKYTKQQLLDQELINGQEFTVPVYNIEEGRTYRVVTFVRDYQSNNLPMIETIEAAN